MKINFKYNLEDKVCIKYDGRYGKTVFTILGREYSETLSHQHYKYNLFNSIQESVIVEEHMLESAPKEKSN